MSCERVELSEGGERGQLVSYRYAMLHISIVTVFPNNGISRQDATSTYMAYNES